MVEVGLNRTLLGVILPKKVMRLFIRPLLGWSGWVSVAGKRFSTVLCAMLSQRIKLLLCVCGLTACQQTDPGTAPTPPGPAPVDVTLDLTKTHQTITGFGGFGAQNVYWSNGPFTSARFVRDVVDDLGCTIIRDELPTSFEIDNDNADPAVTDLTKYNLTRRVPGHHVPFGDRVPHLKALHRATPNCCRWRS